MRAMSKRRRIYATLATVGLSSSLLACSGESSNDSNSDVGLGGESSSGGEASASGGSESTGGAGATGGQATTGGSQNTGGVATGGGNTGGVATGGGNTGGTCAAGMDLSKYVRVERYDLPEPTRITPPNGTSLLAQEASSVTYNWDTDTLFVVGDGGTSIVQVTKTGELIDSMSLAPGGSSHGTEFYDTEGISYVGDGEFVLTEERYRQVNLFTYVAGATLQRADVKTAKLGTTIDNVGIEGVTYDPSTGGYIFLKEKDPKAIFQTGIDFAAGTATNGSPNANGSTDLFNPALVSTLDFSDVFALSNLPDLACDATYDDLLILSQESAKIVQVDRSGNVKHTMTIVADASDTISVPDMTTEGLTMDRDGYLYLVNENGGGDSHHPELWVYAPSTAPNLAPTAVSLAGAAPSIPEDTTTANPVKLADIVVTDDGLGDNDLSLSGPDAGSFEIVGTALFLKAGTQLNAATQSSYDVTIEVDDATVGTAPDASVEYVLTITEATSGETNVAVTEVAAWSSGNSPLGSDWFEVTNFGTSAVSLIGWTVDDNSNSAASAVPLNGVTSIKPGESVIFIESANEAELAAKAQAFIDLWFGGTAPAGLQIGNYYGAGIGLSTGGDAVNLFDDTDTLQASVSFGSSPGAAPYATFDNSVGLSNVVVSTLSVVGHYGAFVAANDANEIGSPGTIAAGAQPVVGIVAVDDQASEVGSDGGVFRFTRTGSTTSPLTVIYSVDTIAGTATADDYTPTLNGSQTIPAGASYIEVTIAPVNDDLVEGTELLTLTLSDTGNYDVGTDESATVYIADDDSDNVGPTIVISEVAPWSSSNSTLAADWFEVTNTGDTTVDITGWRVDDSSHSFASALVLSGVTSIAPGEAVIFIETSDLAGKAAAFNTLWFGANAASTPQIGSYSGSGIGLSGSGDEVTLFDAAGNLVAGVGFGASPTAAPFGTFDNHAGVGGNTLPLGATSTLSLVGVNGAFAAAGDANEVGSPGQ